jgi:hypothetical protein
MKGGEGFIWEIQNRLLRKLLLLRLKCFETGEQVQHPKPPPEVLYLRSRLKKLNNIPAEQDDVSHLALYFKNPFNIMKVNVL